ncbi:hypothetical protein ASPWEDRAFT_39644 [Aspergillus wentii DTO 134E9]|uniref:Altered inheritance of mitochondria protein 9, mitochondrial n=1 Tax=Aspergillus wentii DTO 134E9 TaxID=1073089 RepID=A0A1L9RSM8_ASPWE|nr:uncharacterized protein ASPWEDRAFT_39644 [Aspergillus wentii DTO 134E9]OJJ37932.1 hypothetical protein ASPWEDRAFT_39644 [Aspergillus wentii DTO 134E9]
MSSVGLQSRILSRHITRKSVLNGLVPSHQRQSMRVFSFFSWGAGQPKSHQPELYQERQNGIDERVTEEDLYRYRKHRWLFNEQHELLKRYVKFNLQQLIKVAVGVSDGARSCTKIVKCSEGLHNKAFILTMDNGMEVFAKLPNPNAGPARYTTASEVATRDLLRDVYKIPVPRVLAWSSDPRNPVEAEYIIEEKAPGVRLGSVWHQWPRETKLKLIMQIADIENTLTNISFPRHGSIYFKDDLRELVGHAEHIDMDNSSEDLQHFSIGPLTSAELWNGGRGDMKLDRGPWQNAVEYTQALGRNEISWIEKHAKPRMNYHRSSQSPENPGDGLALLKQYMDVAPYLVPTDKAASSNILWHPDLHLDNVFVNPDTHTITRIVDWQSACVAPLFYQSSVPRMFRHTGPVAEGWVVPQRPEDFESLSDEEQNKIDADLESQIIHKYYEAQVYKRAPLHWAVLQQKSIPAIRKPVWLVNGIWESRDLFFLRDALIELVADWDDIFNGQPCPITFTEEELDMHVKEDENMNGVGQMLALFRDQGVLPVDGMVEAEDYEVAKENCSKFKDVFINLSKDEEERNLFERLWPYKEDE